MKKRLVIFAIICVHAIQGGAQVMTFEKTYGGAEEDVGYSIRQTADGGYIIAGWTRSFGAGGADVYLIKTDTAGDTLWTRTFGGDGDDLGLSVQQTSDGGYIITGWTVSFGAGLEDVYLIKTDANGDAQWTKTFGGALLDKGRSVQQTTDGGYIIGGESFAAGAGGMNVYLIKTDANGDMAWSQSIHELLNDMGYSVQQTTDGGYVVAGYTQAMTGFYDAYLVKTNATGDVTWTKAFGGVNMDFAVSVQQTVDGGYILTGNTISFSPPPEDVYLIKTDASGEESWTKTYGGADEDAGYFVQQTNDGGYIVTGVTGSRTTGDYDVHIIKTDASGSTSWTRTFGGGGNEQSYSIRQTDDGGFALAGQASSIGAGDADVYFIKTDESGNVGTVGVESTQGTGPAGHFSLEQNYPNPFNPSTVITYQLANAEEVSLEVFSVVGQKIRTLITEHQNAGVHSHTWDGKDDDGNAVSSGIYFYRLQAGNISQVKKMSLLR